MSHHSKAFETDAGVGNDVISESNKMDHRKTQHFTRGKVGKISPMPGSLPHAWIENYRVIFCELTVKHFT
jgi:hypothetical protein